MTEPTLSIIVPMYNEDDSLSLFFERIEPVLEGLGVGYEMLCIDDGSRDGTLAQLRVHALRNPAIRVLVLSRNFGKEAALSAGLDHCRGAAVVPIDVDLQDPPELIPEMMQEWRNGFDVVYAQRRERSADSWVKRRSAHLFYRLFNFVSETPIPFDTGDFRLMDRRVVEALRRMPERSRFMKGMFAWVGFRQTSLDYDRTARAAGNSKWQYVKLWKFALDGIIAFSTLPLRIWSYLGLVTALVALVYGLLIVIRTLVRGVDVPGYASLLTAVLFIGGINLLCLGVVGEYLSRIYTEVKQRPIYLIREELGAAVAPSPPRARRRKASE